VDAPRELAPPFGVLAFAASVGFSVVLAAGFAPKRLPAGAGVEPAPLAVLVFAAAGVLAVAAVDVVPAV
jgi:hypothetical protein